jgi:hypothetical protein
MYTGFSGSFLDGTQLSHPFHVTQADILLDAYIVAREILEDCAHLPT